MKYLASFRTTLKASRYMFRALALVLWLLIAFSSVFYIVNALHQRESEIRQEFNLSSDQAQRFIQRTSDVMKELKYIAENRLSAENGVLSPRGRETQADVPATVRAGQAHSHASLGWETFTDKVISLINQHREGVVFLLWGSHAQKKGAIIDKQRHHVLKAPHPSPLSAHRGFFGCNHFVLANQWLEQRGETPIDWMPVLPAESE